MKYFDPKYSIFIWLFTGTNLKERLHLEDFIISFSKTYYTIYHFLSSQCNFYLFYFICFILGMNNKHDKYYWNLRRKKSIQSKKPIEGKYGNSNGNETNHLQYGFDTNDWTDTIKNSKLSFSSEKNRTIDTFPTT